MPTTVISDSVTATSGFNITNSDDHFFTVTSFREATGTNDEAIFTSNGDTVRSVVTLAGTAIGNRVGVELDGSDILVVTQTGTVLSERAFGIRTLWQDNEVVVAGFVGSTDSGVELDGDRDRLHITQTGVVSGAQDAGIQFRPAGVNMRGADNVLINDGLITVGTDGTAAAVTNFNTRNDPSAVLNATLINSGQIVGDVLLGAGVDTYDARGGGQVIGQIDLGDGDDVFRGGALDEEATGGAGADRMSGGDGEDRLEGGTGEDLLRGGQGKDDLRGGADADTLRGHADDDDLIGGGGNDLLVGGRGDDELKGGGGADELRGDSGDDVMTGGSGGDTFVFRAGFGNDVITDFKDNNAEKIDLSDIAQIAGFNDLRANHLTQDGADAVITVGENTIRLVGFDRADLDLGDFLF